MHGGRQQSARCWQIRSGQTKPSQGKWRNTLSAFSLQAADSTYIQFDQVEDMAELTHLNEASVVHNLSQRFRHDRIYVGPRSDAEKLQRC